jgi:cell division septum initiation protein DivIVA
VPINPQQLKTTLDQLHRDIAQLDKTDPALRQQLLQALAEIQATLQNEAGATGPAKAATSAKRDSLIKRLRETAQRFEASHPALSENIGGLIDTLGQSGI